MIYRKLGLAFGALWLSFQPASAVTYDITDVFNLTASGFRTSVFHTATSNGGKSGDILAIAVESTATGTYVTETGAISFSFDVTRQSDSAVFNVQGTGDLDVTGSGNLAGHIDFSFDSEIDGLLSASVLFLDYDYGEPNAFDDVAELISLWGAAGTPTSNGNFQVPAILGADLRIKLGNPRQSMNPVPIPAALPLFAGGLGLLGLLGWRRRRGDSVA